jgi:hypothetical protein
VRKQIVAMGSPPSPTDGHPRRIQLGQRLELDQVTCAISAVTEALDRQRVRLGLSDGHHVFGLVSETTIQAAKQQPPSDGSCAIRPRSKLMFPWAYDQRDLARASEFGNAQFATEFAKGEDDSAHIFLVSVQYDCGTLRLTRLAFYDSAPGVCRSDHKTWGLIKSHIRRTATNFGVFASPAIGYSASLSGIGIALEE